MSKFKVGDSVRVKDCGIGGVARATKGQYAEVTSVLDNGDPVVTMETGDDEGIDYFAIDDELELVA